MTRRKNHESPRFHVEQDEHPGDTPDRMSSDLLAALVGLSFSLVVTLILLIYLWTS